MEKRIIENEQEAFKTPDGYFEGFEAKIMSRIHSEESAPETKRKSMIDSMRETAADVERAERMAPKAETEKRYMVWLRPTAIAAVVIPFIIFCSVALKSYLTSIDEKSEQIVAATTQDEYYDEVNNELTSAEIEDALAEIEYENQDNE